MLKKLLLLAGIAMTLPGADAEAGVRLNIGIGLPLFAPFCPPPRPVYVVPQPVYLAPAPVYVRPRPSMFSPRRFTSLRHRLPPTCSRPQCRLRGSSLPGKNNGKSRDGKVSPFSTGCWRRLQSCLATRLLEGPQLVAQGGIGRTHLHRAALNRKCIIAAAAFKEGAGQPVQDDAVFAVAERGGAFEIAEGAGSPRSRRTRPRT